MNDVMSVFIQLAPNHVAQGFYTLDGNRITMTYANGQPVLMDDDEPVTATAEPHMIEPVARTLTKRIRKWAIGDSVPGFGHHEEIGAGYGGRDAEGFGRALEYPSDGVA